MEILRKHINELEFFLSEREHSEEVLRDALREVYNELDKLASQQADYVQTEYALYYRAEFEKIIITIPINLTKLSPGKIHSAINNALKMSNILIIDDEMPPYIHLPIISNSLLRKINLLKADISLCPLGAKYNKLTWG